MLAMLAGGSAMAQYYNDYYHRTGDTIYYLSEIGYYKWWDLQGMLNNNHHFQGYISHEYYPVVVTDYFTPAQIKVLGIAGYLGSHCGPYDVDTTSAPEYFYLFTNNIGRPVFNKRVQWDLAALHRTFYFEAGHAFPYGSDTCCHFEIDHGYVPLYECYFDTAVYVSDTFYVGWSYHSNCIPRTPDNFSSLTETDYLLFRNMAIMNPCSEEDTVFHSDGMWPSIYNSGVCYFPIFDYWRCTDTSIATNPADTNLTWVHYRSQYIPLIYPIIEIDTTQPPTWLCDPVQNVQVTPDGDSCAIVTWDDFLHYSSCEVEYYSLLEGYPGRHTVTVTDNMVRICDLDSTATYMVRVRAICDTSKQETDWTSWVTFTLPHNTESVDEASVLAKYTGVMPNPASESFTVFSSFGLTRIEVYNMRGLLVYSGEAGYTNTNVSLKGWAPGQYIVMIETPAGKTAKRLTVVR